MRPFSSPAAVALPAIGACRSSSLTEPSCLACGYVFAECEGIYNALPPDREWTFRQFVHDYESVRAKEGRVLVAPTIIWHSLQGSQCRNEWQWHIRARTYRFMEKHLLPKIETTYPRGCDVLDVGAAMDGCLIGWHNVGIVRWLSTCWLMTLMASAQLGIISPCTPFLRFKAEWIAFRFCLHSSCGDFQRVAPLLDRLPEHSRGSAAMSAKGGI